MAAAAAAAGVDEACPASDEEEARSEDDGEGLEPVDVEEPPRVESCNPPPLSESLDRQLSISPPESDFIEYL